MKKLFLCLALCLVNTSCMLQINIASSPNNMPPIIKAQHNSDNATMTGSSLEDIKPSNDAGDVEVPLK